jgi:hypothetical protein
MNSHHLRWAACAGAVVVCAASPASASTSGAYYSGGGADCAGQWYSLTHPTHAGQFAIMDRAGGADDDYCYVKYDRTRRVSIPEDSAIGRWQYRTADVRGIGEQIYFQVCEERDHDPDLCSFQAAHSLK